jgi:hypothetical protein
VGIEPTWITPQDFKSCASNLFRHSDIFVTPTGIEPVIPWLKARCFTYSATKSYCGDSENRIHHILVANQNRQALVHVSPFFICGRSRCRSQCKFAPTVFKTGSQAAVIHLPIIYIYLEGLEPSTFRLEDENSSIELQIYFCGPGGT